MNPKLGELWSNPNGCFSAVVIGMAFDSYDVKHCQFKTETTIGCCQNKDDTFDRAFDSMRGWYKICLITARKKHES